MMANQMVGLGGQLEVEREREEGGLFQGIWPKRMQRRKKGRQKII